MHKWQRAPHDRSPQTKANRRRRLSAGQLPPAPANERQQSNRAAAISRKIRPKSRRPLERASEQWLSWRQPDQALETISWLGDEEAGSALLFLFFSFFPVVVGGVAAHKKESRTLGARQRCSSGQPGGASLIWSRRRQSRNGHGLPSAMTRKLHCVCIEFLFG